MQTDIIRKCWLLTGYLKPEQMAPETKQVLNDHHLVSDSDSPAESNEDLYN